jgi:hypothetical protein
METVLASSINPSSGTPIPWPMRTSAFVPTNIPIICGMLLTAPTPFNTFLWQWVNQTYNAGLNFGNRNASAQTSLKETLTSYSMAVAMAILMATAMRRGTAPLMKGREGTFVGSALNSTVSFVAVAFTSAINAGVMRKGELVSGIQVQEPDGENKEVGLSQAAAKSAL